MCVKPVHKKGAKTCRDNHKPLGILSDTLLFKKNGWIFDDNTSEKFI